MKDIKILDSDKINVLRKQNLLNIFMELIKNILNRLKRIIRWIPFLWNNHDWDFVFLLETIKFKMNDIKKFHHSSNAITCEYQLNIIRNTLDRSLSLLEGYINDIYLDEYVEVLHNTNEYKKNFIATYERKIQSGIIKFPGEKEDLDNQIRLIYYYKQEKIKKLFFTSLEQYHELWWD